MSPLQLALRHLTRKKIPTLITLVSIAVAVACGSVLLKLYIMSNARFSTLVHGPDAVLGAKGGGIEILLGSLGLDGTYPDFIPDRLYHTLKDRRALRFEDSSEFSTSMLKNVVPIVYFGTHHNSRIVGTDERFFVSPSPGTGPGLSEGRRFGPFGEVVIGALVSKNEHLAPGDSIDCAAWIGNHQAHADSVPFRLRVVGILKERGDAWDRACFSSMAQAHQVFERTRMESETSWKADVLHYILISLPPGGFAPLADLVNRRTVAELISVDEQMHQLQAITGSGVRLGWSIMILVLFLGSLCVAAVMITRVEAMSLQLAVLRALGFTKWEISRWLLWEGVLLGGCACLAGGLIEGLTFPSIRLALGTFLPAPDVVPCPFYYSAPVWIASLCATVLAVGVPLLRLYRQDVHASLQGI